MSQDSYKMPEFLATIAKPSPTFPVANDQGISIKVALPTHS